MSRKAGGQDLVDSLKGLVVTLAPDIQADGGDLKTVEDQFVHLEARDKNFHKYKFVKQLRAQIDDSLGDLIDTEIEKHSISTNEAGAAQVPLVTKLTDRIMQSAEYANLAQTLKDNVTKACDHLLQNFEKEFSPEEQKKHSPRNKPITGISDILSEGDSSFGDDSLLNQSTCVFWTNETYQRLARDLSKKQDIQTRHEAMRKIVLNTTITMDAQNFELIKPGLQEALWDPDEALSHLAFKYIAKGLAYNEPGTKDIYTILVDFLSQQFQTGSNNTLPKAKSGIDCRRPDIVKLLRSFRLINEFQQQIPQYWVRYPERFRDDIIESTLSLLSTRQQSDLELTPAHFLSLVDTRAKWFIRWMHGHYSRAPLLKHLGKHRPVVEQAVKSCLEYTTSRKLSSSAASESSGSASSRTTPRGSQQRTLRVQYSGPELQFIYFIHSVNMLGQVLRYREGRSIFPVKVKGREEPVTVSNLLVSLIQIITDSSVNIPSKSPALQYDPGTLVTEVLKTICSSETVCEECICTDDIISALLTPISHWLKGSHDGSTVVPCESTLLHLADILSVIATCGCGRQMLLYGQSRNNFTKSRSSAAHTLANFANKALSEELSQDTFTPPSKAVIGNFVFLCRQLYNTCEGLQVLSTYNLHNSIAGEWRVANREAEMAATPTPSIDGRENNSAGKESQYTMLWEETLRDNLLNFAGTPKGLLLLQQTGSINECVSYMYSRYERKLQVSKCEKFGYGYMMSQIVATAPGAVALQGTGFIPDLVRRVWGALEVIDDKPVYTPRPWPVLPVDKASRKGFISLVNLLSSYATVYEVLAGQPLPTKESYSFRESPQNIPGLIDRLVLLDTDSKMHSLFNPEQSHVFGLRLLSVLTCCLDTCLLLQTQYNFQNILLRCQAQNVLEGSSDMIVDMPSIERNHLLVRTYVIGGPTERVLPPRELTVENQRTNDVYPYPLFSSYPVPKNYVGGQTSKGPVKQGTDNPMTKFFIESKKLESGLQWLDKCKKAFSGLLTFKLDQARGVVLQDLLERCVKVLCQNPQEALFPLVDYTGSESTVTNFTLTPVQQLGIEVTIRYGMQLKLLSSVKESSEKLTQLLKQTSYYLSQQQKTASGSSLGCLQRHSTGFDWFVATVFLMMHGNAERAWKVLHQLSALLTSGYLWTQRLHASKHLPASLMQSGIPPVFSRTCHNIELILQIELPHIYSAFKMSGFAPAQICQHWLRQCFWNYLDWAEICHYVCLCLVLGIDYQAYLCVAILRARCRQILQHSQQKNLIVFLKEEPIHGFRVGEHLEFMQQLEKKFRKTVLGDMQNIAKP